MKLSAWHSCPRGGPATTTSSPRIRRWPSDSGSAAPLTPVRGAGPLRQRCRRVVAGRVLLVGDAAGYVDALTGEGIAISLAAADESWPTALVADRPLDYEAAWRRASRRYRLLTHTLRAGPAAAHRPADDHSAGWTDAEAVRRGCRSAGAVSVVRGRTGLPSAEPIDAEESGVDIDDLAAGEACARGKLVDDGGTQRPCRARRTADPPSRPAGNGQYSSRTSFAR